jgi:transketolase
MSGSEIMPGFEMTGGSLGHGLSQAVGMALGLRLDARDARIFNLLSDGEMQEGATWEAAMAGAHYRLGNLFAFIDCNNQQADGPPSRIMGIEPVDEKWAAFGWHTQRSDGNDIKALLSAHDAANRVNDRPHAIVLDTLLGKGVPLFEQREKNHFIRVEAEEWHIARQQLESGDGW